MKFNRLTVIRTYNIGNKEYADCICDCGKERPRVPMINLKRDEIKQCADCAKEARRQGHRTACAGAFKSNQF